MNYAEMYPQTLDDAVARLLETMSEADKDVLKSIQEEDLVIYNGSWGAAIRNSFGLWSDNAALLESTGTSHPDDASLVIIQTLWSKLRHETPSAGSPVKKETTMANERRPWLSSTVKKMGLPNNPMPLELADKLKRGFAIVRPRKDSGRPQLPPETRGSKED